jgi:hypothetical protein
VYDGILSPDSLSRRILVCQIAGHPLNVTGSSIDVRHAQVRNPDLMDRAEMLNDSLADLPVAASHEHLHFNSPALLASTRRAHVRTHV